LSYNDMCNDLTHVFMQQLFLFNFSFSLIEYYRKNYISNREESHV